MRKQQARGTPRRARFKMTNSKFQIIARAREKPDYKIVISNV
jgi:hypothetical protein